MGEATLRVVGVGMTCERLLAPGALVEGPQLGRDALEDVGETFDLVECRVTPDEGVSEIANRSTGTTARLPNGEIVFDRLSGRVSTHG